MSTNSGNFKEEFVLSIADFGMAKVDTEDLLELSAKREDPETGGMRKVSSPFYYAMTGFGWDDRITEPLMQEFHNYVESDLVVGLNTGGNSMASVYRGWSLGADLSSPRLVPARKDDEEEKYQGLDRFGLPPVEDFDGKSVDLIDDVATTGASLEKLHEDLDEAGADVGSWNVAVNRMEGAQERADRQGADLNAVVSGEEALDILYANDRISETEYDTGQAYLEGPVAWNMENVWD